MVDGVIIWILCQLFFHVFIWFLLLQINMMENAIRYRLHEVSIRSKVILKREESLTWILLPCRDVESTRVRVRPYGEDFKIYKYRGKFFEKYFPFINKFSQFSRRILFSIYASIRSCTVLVSFIFVKLRKRPSFFLSYC